MTFLSPCPLPLPHPPPPRPGKADDPVKLIDPLKSQDGARRPETEISLQPGAHSNGSDGSARRPFFFIINEGNHFLDFPYFPPPPGGRPTVAAGPPTAPHPLPSLRAFRSGPTAIITIPTHPSSLSLSLASQAREQEKNIPELYKENVNIVIDGR